MSYNEYDPWADLRAAEREDAQVELDVLKAQNEKLERQIKALQTKDPDAPTERLAAEPGEDVETVRARVAAVKAASQTPEAGDPDKLSELLDKLDPHDYEGAVRAFDQAGFIRQDALGQSWQNGRIQRSGEPKGSTEEIYAYLDVATSLEDYTARLRAVGLTENEAAY
jgi:hypothetical protein